MSAFLTALVLANVLLWASLAIMHWVNAAQRRTITVQTVEIDILRAAIERVRDMHQTDGSEPPSCAYCFYIDPTWPCHTIAALDGAS